MYVIIYRRFCVRVEIPKARVPLAFEVDAFTRKIKMKIIVSDRTDFVLVYERGGYVSPRYS